MRTNLALQDAPSPILPAISIRGKKVRVLDVAIPRRSQAGPLTPSLASMAHFTLDLPTLRTLRFVALAVTQRAPCLLEGETATTKTSAVEFLAALAQANLVRLNLNGQTDASELVGRYVPNVGGLGVDPKALLQHARWLKPETVEMLRKAQEGSLDKVAGILIAAQEGLPLTTWRFQEGYIPQALRFGWWVLLDELNLAEPQIVERLNSVLEREPSLVLTEGEGTRFGPQGEVPVHPDFRIFATMNPATYVGRTPLSPAFRNRWTFTCSVSLPSEAEYLQMLRCVVYGEQPVVEWEGVLYCGIEPPLAEEPPFARLAEVAGLEEFLERLATFHAKMVALTQPTDGQPPTLGQGRRDRYVFTRRDLLTVLDLLQNSPLLHPATGRPLTFRQDPRVVALQAIEQVYLARLADAEERGKVDQVLRALGLSRHLWACTLGNGTPLPPPSQRQCLTLHPAVLWQTLSSHLQEGEAIVLEMDLREGTLELSTSPHAGEGRADFDSLLEVFDAQGQRVAFDDDGGQGLTSHLRFPVPAPGKYCVRLSAVGEGGEFRLAYRLEGGPAVPLLVPQETWASVVASLARGQCWAFPFQAKEGEAFLFSTSPGSGDGFADFDTVIGVYHEGKCLAQDDDGGEGKTSFLQWVAPKDGRYEIRVWGYKDSHAGRFRLAYRRSEPVPEIRLTSSWQRIEGEVTAEERRQLYRFSAKRGQSVVFSTSPSTGGGRADFDTVLELYELSTWKRLAQDDDGGDGTTSLLRYTIPETGKYLILVRGCGSATGHYTLAFRLEG